MRRTFLPHSVLGHPGGRPTRHPPRGRRGGAGGGGAAPRRRGAHCPRTPASPGTLASPRGRWAHARPASPGRREIPNLLRIRSESAPNLAPNLRGAAGGRIAPGHLRLLGHWRLTGDAGTPLGTRAPMRDMPPPTETRDSEHAPKAGRISRRGGGRQVVARFQRPLLLWTERASAPLPA